LYFAVMNLLRASMKIKTLLTILLLLSAAPSQAQTDPAEVKAILSQSLEPRDVVTFQLQQFLLKRVPKLPAPASAAEWNMQEQRLRNHLLRDVIFHGWPEAWVHSAPQFQDVGLIPGGKGYQLHKLRYEIVPGFYATALLYAPERLSGKLPAILDVMGHFPAGGKAMEFEQKLCINQALEGMIALNLEWINMGELHAEGNDHWFAADLDLVGANGVGLFYLAMRRGLDYLWDNPHVDRKRIGMTGLSGGGWQTIVLSSLDPRVKAAIPVAGFASLEGRAERLPGEPGDLEQNATDFLAGQDYPELVAIRAPRPTLILDNTDDNCCFRAPLVKPFVYDAVKPFFRLYGKESSFEFHADTSIAAHNEGLDNREQIYHFFAKAFGIPILQKEIPVGEAVKSYDDLRVGVPGDNLTILGLARRMADEIKRRTIPSGSSQRAQWSAEERNQLRQVVRYHAVEVARAWPEFNTYHNQVESISYRFEMDNGLSATGTWIKDVPTPANAAMTVFLNDQGRKGAGAEIWDRFPAVAARLERGEQALVLDLLFTGEGAPSNHAELLAEMLAATGERPLGMEAAQLIGITHWARQTWAPQRVRLESDGVRSQMVSLIAAALEPKLFSTVEVHQGMRSLSYLLEKPVRYQDAPDLFCLDLYKDFDIKTLEALTVPTKVTENYLK
jgi:predicted 2-oxoglutarate/Fe(II)-dependent dioxygenase YbiX